MSKYFIVLVLLLFYGGASILESSILDSAILDPSILKASMFTTKITGDLNPINPNKLGISNLWTFPVQIYQISAIQANIQILPQGFPSTTMYVYAAKVNNTLIPSYPGPSIVGLKNQPLNIIWSNNIIGPHILPIDTSPPMDMIKQFLNEVPIVPHVHGLQTQMGSDGQSMGFWTASGKKGDDYFSLQSQQAKPNEAIFRYQITKDSLSWYHDHTMTITRQNVYAGLAGYYQTINPFMSQQEKNILLSYGDFQRKHFMISDKSFYTNGSLFYPQTSESNLFTSWNPQFFGNTIIVNGKLWPKVVLQQKKYRFVFINSCQSRFLQISFEVDEKPIQFQLFRRDSDYLRTPLTLKKYLLLIGGRIQIFLDLTGFAGEIVLKNSAPTPYPDGDAVDQYTSQIMKIIVASYVKIKPSLTYLQLIEHKLNFYTKKCPNSSIYNQNGLDFLNQSTFGHRVIKSQDYLNSIDENNTFQISFIYRAISIQANTKYGQYKILQNLLINADNLLNAIKNYYEPKVSIIVPITDVPYPRFEQTQGNLVFPVLIQLDDPQGEVSSVMIDGLGLQYGCQGSSYKVGKVYDFYIINLTMDDHPIHIHLVNFQIIGRFFFDVDKYLADYLALNGDIGFYGYNKAPKQIDVRPYQTSSIQNPNSEQKLFADVIHCPLGTVTIARVKFSNNYGKPFPFDVVNSKYVWHCHILEHEDNSMMRYFCLE